MRPRREPGTRSSVALPHTPLSRPSGLLRASRPGTRPARDPGVDGLQAIADLARTDAHCRDLPAAAHRTDASSAPTTAPQPGRPSAIVRAPALGIRNTRSTWGRLGRSVGSRPPTSTAAEPRPMRCKIIEGLQPADEIWGPAQEVSENAPPDPGVPHRVRALAEACEHRGQHWPGPAGSRGSLGLFSRIVAIWSSRTSCAMPPIGRGPGALGRVRSRCPAARDLDGGERDARRGVPLPRPCRGHAQADVLLRETPKTRGQRK